MTREELAALKALHEAATPGEWFRNPNTHTVCGPDGADLGWFYKQSVDGNLANAISTAALHNAAPQLITAARDSLDLRERMAKLAAKGNSDETWAELLALLETP